MAKHTRKPTRSSFDNGNANPDLTSHAVVPGSQRVPLAGAKAVGAANPHAVIELTLKLRRKQDLPDFESRPRTPMSRDELASKFGASTDDIDKVKKVFAKLGLKTDKADPATRTVKISGPIKKVQDAFLVKLFKYEHATGSYRGRVGAVHVPTDVADIVQGVFGLDTRRVAKRRRHPVRASQIFRALSHHPPSWYIPEELAKHYNFPASTGAGQTVGLLEFGGGFFQDDLDQFCKMAKVNSPNVDALSADGTSTSARDGAEGEVMLDVEVVAGACPDAHIVVYFAEFTEQGWIDLLDFIMQDKKNNPNVLSISWGAAEDTDVWTRAAMKQVNESLKDAAMMGMTICVAGGDDGSSDAVLDGHAHADFPASSPYVLAVGGTTIPKKHGTGRDIVWFEGDGLREDSGGSTGGAVSAVFRRPKWQSKIKIASVNPGAIRGRIIPDLSANADWDASPYLLVVDGQSEPNGGTSAAAPLVASLIARINAIRESNSQQPIGYLTPVLYRGANGNGGTPVGQAGCTDVVDGNNDTAAVGGYPAAPGYDAASGWGTPDGSKLLQALQFLP